MYCHRCGNQLPDGSEFCNRCGAKMKTADERLRRPSPVAPPPRPARRHPIVESRPTPKPVENEEEGFNSQVYARRRDRQDDQQNSRQVNSRQVNQGNVKYNKEGHRVVFRIHQTFLPVALAYIGSIVFALIMAAFIAYLKGPLLLVLVLAVLSFIPAISKHLNLLRTVYILTENKIEIETGILSKSSHSIPLRHVIDVEVTESFKERLVGIGDIDIDTALSESKMRFDNISNPRKYAQMILDQLPDD